jgi:hypothetical protein
MPFHDVKGWGQIVTPLELYTVCVQLICAVIIEEDEYRPDCWRFDQKMFILL